MEINEQSIKQLFVDTRPLKTELPVITNNPKYIFRDESWQHIQEFAFTDGNYLWNCNHNTDISRISSKGNIIEIHSSRKNNNWNVLYFKNACANNFEFSFEIISHNILDEIQVSFVAEDLRNRYRFMIRENEFAVFEVVHNGNFYRYIRKEKYPFSLNERHLIKVVGINDNYQLFIDNKLLFSIKDTIKLTSGRDIALIVYNRENLYDINCEVSNILLKNKVKYTNRVGILTYHRSHNYGAYLQALCLCNRLNEENDINCEIIDYRTIKEKINYSIPKIKILSNNLSDSITNLRRKAFYRNLFNGFETAASDKLLIKSKNSLLSDNIDEFTKFVNNKYDVIVAGSDEIWKVDGFRGFPTAYWLWNNIHAFKMSYAVSSRSNFLSLSNEDVDLIKANLDTYKYLSVRDEITKASIKTLTDKEVYLQPDPSFIYDLPSVNINKIKRKATMNCKKKNILVIFDSPNNDILSKKLYKELVPKYNLVSAYRYCNYMHNISSLSPLQWTELIKESDFVITNLYHGVCYSMIYNTPYIAIGTKDKKSKILSLLSKENDLENRYYDCIEDILKVDLIELIQKKSYYYDNSKYIKTCRDSFNDFICELKKLK